MSNTELYLEYSNRSRTLQNMLNFKTHSVSDFDLAESMTLGMTSLLRAKFNDHQTLLQALFDFSTFESRCSLFWDGIVANRSANKSRPTTSANQYTTPAHPRSKEENIWRVHAYLDLMKLCRFCRKQCGSAAGACTGTMDQSFVHIPASFVAPPIPADWKPPVGRGSGSTSSSAGKPTQPPAGRPPGRSVTVSGIAEESTEQNLDVASLSAISAIDYELQLALSEGYVPPSNPHRLLVQFTHEGQDSRGLIDTGSEVNIISTKTIERVGLNTFTSDKPTIVNLAMDNTGLTPIILRESAKVSLSALWSPLSFNDVILKVGPIKGDYDMILGIHFLSRFNLSASIFYHSLQCAHSGCNIFDYWVPIEIQKKFSLYSQPSVASIESTMEYPCKESEKLILQEFKDLFPEDIPAVSDAAESEGLFTDGAFPDKLQLESSKVRHKIVLTNPDIIVNER
ncbi:hypothetical protein Pst134EA_032515 [Puccinia striiformis f. sp. tritici]|uniref:uncharacterized protein n=1 Tax=Puccinia striiformis f. sp. tritici TaxID=168172 RepID=UPI002008E8B2|nr:uncharacterized protein Pst134EA_032515 [Puccinia striiformis f. sp. tritici]KAH9441738.1 hypothetical protein Pst134EA_032515 [Puccinia striiformis f. sp. tritici]